MNVITALRIQQRDKERVSVFLDGEYAFSITLIAAAQLRKGQELSTQEVEQLRSNDDVQRAVDHAARFLSYRPRSSTEVQRNLKKNSFEETVIERAIARLNELGYLDDTAFARYWLENRSTFKPRSSSALRYELRQKGVADSVIESVLPDVDDHAAAYRAGREKARRLRGLERAVFHKKLSGFLQRRGFNYGISRDVIQQIEAELVEDDVDFFAEVSEE